MHYSFDKIEGTMQNLKELYHGQNREQSEIYDAKCNILGAECCRVEISIVANATVAARTEPLVDHLLEARIISE